MTRFLPLLLCAWLAAALLGCKEEKEPPFTDLVDPFAREAAKEWVFTETHIPFGNLRFLPVSAASDRLPAFLYAYCSEADTTIPQAIRVMPTVRRPASSDTTELLAAFGATTLAPGNETADPGAYGVTMNNGISADFSLTKHCGMHSFRFPKGESYGILLDLSPVVANRSVLKTSLWKASNRVLQGYRRIATPDGERDIFFCLEFSQNVEVWTGERFQQKLTNGQEVTGSSTLAWIDFGSTTNVILMKVGLSLQTEEEAFNYLQTEIPHWSLDKVKREATQAWRKLLARVRVKSDDTPALQAFYTALYHAYTIPLLYFDIRESYKPTDGGLGDIYRHLRQQEGPEAEKVFAAIGMTPEPDDHTRYRLSCPQFPRIVLRLEQDRRFVIKTNKDNENYDCETTILLNGKPLQRAWIAKEEVVRGGTLEFILTDE